ncbi:unnamed protein product [Owenia fusiformis]|uniref:NWD1/2-like winged helix-turn-helix domain-containing protein n=1 Tax=Owenia fusiformis TaxID=6347 RepID=A0A8J1UV30_OWEFU|nr:unnamed protein product [Owenia fusiformis]
MIQPKKKREKEGKFSPLSMTSSPAVSPMSRHEDCAYTAPEMYAMRQLHKAGQRGIRHTALPGSLQPLNRSSHVRSAPNSKFDATMKLPKVMNKVEFAPNQKVLPQIGNEKVQGQDHAQNVYRGNLDSSIPNTPSNVVRIYLSTGGTDFEAERAMLQDKVFPQLRHVCAKHGLELNVVDLREDSDLYSADLGRHEIQQCRSLSIGPFVMVLLGDKYGSWQVPYQFSESQYVKMKTGQFEKRDTVLQCYIHDEGSSSGMGTYTLKENLTEEQLQKLYDTFQEIGAHNLSSELQNEIHMALPLHSNTPGCYVYQRHFKDTDNKEQNPDLLDVSTDQNTTKIQQKNMDDLRQYVKNSNTSKVWRYTVPYSKNGISIKDKDHEKYLEKIQQDVLSDFTTAIQSSVMKIAGQMTSPIYMEVLQHTSIAKVMCESFYQQAEIIAQVKIYLNSKEKHPLIIHGLPEIGKSFLMAKLSQLVPTHLGEERTVTLLRFIGLTSDSSIVINLLKSLCTQIHVAFNIPIPFPGITVDTTSFQSMADYLKKLINHLGYGDEAMKNKQLVILLDGINQLSPMDQAMNILNVITDLPPTVRVILSTRSSMGSIDIIEELKKKVPEAKAYLEVQPLSKAEKEKILSSVIQNTNMTMQKEKLEALLEAASSHSLLHLKLLTHHLVDVSSGENLEFSSTLQKSIQVLIKRLQKSNDATVLKYTMAYITISGEGISEVELHDLLSRNSDVMNAISKGRNTPMKHLPSIFLSQVMLDLHPFLIRHMEHGRLVYGWFHHSFMEGVSRELNILYPGQEQSSITEEACDFTLALHRDFVDMFCEPGSDFTMPQPTSAVNLRKLFKLPIHSRVLVPVLGLTHVKQHMFCNLNWLLTKLKATSIDDVMLDFENVFTISDMLEREGIIQAAETEELRIIYKCLKDAQDGLSKQPDKKLKDMCQELIASVPKDAIEKYELIAQLVQDVGPAVQQWLAS